ncbi:hypothetical protein H6758_02710 [Candidatus Nomurabacteria bacterium]|nr:hypothetical protein [Candidatus Nomurabacteria bacterium]
MKRILQIVLRILARRIVGKYQPEIVGITGSVGKTSAKEVATKILAYRFAVRGSAGNYNNEIGLPLTVIGKENPGKSVIGWLAVIFRAVSLLLVKHDDYPEILVLEMGADHPGDIAYLTSIARPTIGVVTAIAPAHMEFFKTIRKLVREKQKIVSCLDKTGVAVLNIDDDNVWGMNTKTDAEVVTYGKSEDAQVRATDIGITTDHQTRWPKGMTFKLHYKGSIVPVHIDGVIGDHFVYSVLVGATVGLSLGMNLVEISESLSSMEMMPGRMRLLPGIKETFLIDDTYNSSPKAVKKAIDALKSCQVSHQTRKIIVLGDMLELGKQSGLEHAQVGVHIAKAQFDYFFAVGSMMKKAAKSAQAEGMPEDKIRIFDNAVDAGRHLQELLHPGDMVLIKGSQGVRCEKIVKEVMAEPLRSKELLVRQSEKWLEE